MTIPTQAEDLAKRDAIARIVDPEAWGECFPLEGDPDPVGAEIFGEAITESLTKADAILSMISAVPSIEGGEGDSGPSQTSPSSEVFAPLPCRPEGQSLSDQERHELECLRNQVGQLAYPCSPHCEGYLRELAMRNGSQRPQSPFVWRDIASEQGGGT